MFVSCVGMVFSASQYSVEDAARVQISASALSNHETPPQRRMDRFPPQQALH